MKVLVLGGSGFVGTHLIPRLLQRGHEVTLLSRGKRSSPLPVRQLRGDVSSGIGLKEALQGQEAVIYLVGIIREKDQSFQAAHVEGVRRTLELIPPSTRVLHMSALGARRGTGSRYFETKAQAEELVEASAASWTILRPSLIFGEGDDFFSNVLKGLVRAPLPFIPQIGDGHFPFRPIWAGDVAEAFAQALEKPETIGKRYDLVGPKEYTFRELLLLEREALGSRKPLVPIPLGLMDLVVPLLHPLPFSPITRDQYIMLKAGNTGDPGPMRQAFALEERPLEVELPRILKLATNQPVSQ